MSRQPSANEVLATVARLARIPLDDLDGYVIVCARGGEVAGTLTNARDEATVVGLLARAIEHRTPAIAKLEAGT